MGAIDESKLNNILPKYDELKLSGKNLAQQYVSAFNTGMNIYQCINQLQGYIEWVVKAVNDVVVQWDEIIDKQIKYAIDKSVDESVKASIDKSVDESVKASINASKQATTEQFNIEWEKVQPVLETSVKASIDKSVDESVKASINASKQATTEQFNIEWEKVQPVLETLENNVSLIKRGIDQYYVLTESKDKNIKKLDYYFKYNFDYLPTAPDYNDRLYVNDLDLEGYVVKRSYLSDNTCKLKNKSTGELIDYVYFMLDDNVTVTTPKDDPQLVYTIIDIRYLPYFAKLKTETPVAGQLYVDMCISIILEKTSS